MARPGQLQGQLSPTGTGSRHSLSLSFLPHWSLLVFPSLLLHQLLYTINITQSGHLEWLA